MRIEGCRSGCDVTKDWDGCGAENRCVVVTVGDTMVVERGPLVVTVVWGPVVV